MAGIPPRYVWLLTICIGVFGATNILNFCSRGEHLWESKPPPKTAEQKVEENDKTGDDEETQYHAALIYHSYRKTPLELLLSAIAAQNTAILLGKNYEWVFKNAAEQVPPWSKAGWYIRTLPWVRKEASKALATLDA